MGMDRQTNYTVLPGGREQIALVVVVSCVKQRKLRWGSSHQFHSSAIHGINKLNALMAGRQDVLV